MGGPLRTLIAARRPGPHPDTTLAIVATEDREDNQDLADGRIHGRGVEIGCPARLVSARLECIQ